MINSRANTYDNRGSPFVPRSNFPLSSFLISRWTDSYSRTNTLGKYPRGGWWGSYACPWANNGVNFLAHVSHHVSFSNREWLYFFEWWFFFSFCEAHSISSSIYIYPRHIYIFHLILCSIWKSRVFVYFFLRSLILFLLDPRRIELYFISYKRYIHGYNC